MFTDEDGQKSCIPSASFKKGKQKCLVCGRIEDWKCRVREDGLIGLCTYCPSDKTDPMGRYIHYFLDDTSQVDKASPSTIDLTKDEKASTEKIMQDEILTPDRVRFLHQAYSAFLAELTLDETHKANLLNRGLAEEAIVKNGYKSVPTYDTRFEVGKCMEPFLQIGSIPGFYLEEGKWCLASTFPGFYVPYRDLNGNIGGLQIRRDDGYKPRYMWLSSNDKQKGASSGVPVHFANPEIVWQTETVYLTEGGLKADIIAERNGEAVVATAGVNVVNPEKVEQAIYAAFPNVETIIIAYDMDFTEKVEVRKALERLVEHLHNSKKAEVKVLYWDPSVGKGLDDVLVSENLSEAYFTTYTAERFLNPVGWDEEIDYSENPVCEKNGIAYSWKNFANLELGKDEPVIFGLVRGNVGLMIASTNIGKSTLSLNLALSATSGRNFEPLLDGAHSAKRVLYIDGETTKAAFQSDIFVMVKALSEKEVLSVKNNLFLICDEELNGELLDLANKEHRSVVEEIAKESKPDLIIVDTLSALMAIEDENDNAKVRKEVMQPLRELARKTNSAVLLLHHTGKYVEGSSATGAYKGRGASVLGALSRAVFSIEKDNATEKRVALVCQKVKGEGFDRTVLELNRASRWFETIEVKPKEQTQYEKVVEYVSGLERIVKRAEISESLNIPNATLGRILEKAEKERDLKRVGHGKYTCPNAQENGQELALAE